MLPWVSAFAFIMQFLNFSHSAFSFVFFPPKLFFFSNRLCVLEQFWIYNNTMKTVQSSCPAPTLSFPHYYLLVWCISLLTIFDTLMYISDNFQKHSFVWSVSASSSPLRNHHSTQAKYHGAGPRWSPCSYSRTVIWGDMLRFQSRTYQYLFSFLVETWNSPKSELWQ